MKYRKINERKEFKILFIIILHTFKKYVETCKFKDIQISSNKIPKNTPLK